MTDELIIEKVLSGNTHIFSEIVEKYKDSIFNMAYRFTYNYNDAQDLSQEVFINAFKKLRSFNESSLFSTWLYRICYNLCIDWSRKGSKRQKTVYLECENQDIADEGKNIEEEYINSQKSKHVRNALNGMKDKYRTVLILYHYQGLSYEEIGEILRMPVKTVETRLYRGRNLLKEILSGETYGGEFYEVQSDTKACKQLSGS